MPRKRRQPPEPIGIETTVKTDPPRPAREELATTPMDMRKLASAPKVTIPCLVILSGGQVGEIIPLRRGSLRIGRADDAEICLRDTSVSRYHARLEVDENQHCEIVDLDSTNGTFLNDTRIKRATISFGDRVQLGNLTILQFEYYGRHEEELHVRLFHAGTYDSLTGVYNRRFLEDRLESEFQLAARHGEEFTLAVLDVDHFKAVNDSWGHLAGDAVLRQIAEIMVARIRLEDILARFGGDEFVLVLRRTSAEGAERVASVIQQRIRDAPCRHQSAVIPLTISVGIATQSPATSYPNGTALFDAADKALLRAKDLGRDRIELARPPTPAAPG